MSNINIRVIGTANMKGMTAPFAAFEAQIAAANKQLEHFLVLQNGMDPKGYERMSKAAAQNSQTFRNAAASTGMFEVQQLRVNKATDDFVSKLQKQKLSFADMLRQHKLVNAAYKEQIKLQDMAATTSTFGTTHGKTTVTTTTPLVARQVQGLEKFNSVMGYSNELLKSGATQMINWGKNTQWAGRQLSMGFTMPIVALGAAAGVMSYQMDKAFTQVAKVYNTTAQSGIKQQKELDAVRRAGMKTAMEAAQQYGQSGKDTLNVQAQLAATGKKGMELQKSTIQVMRIARLGELDYNDAVKTTIALQSVFGMSSQKLGETFNYINDVENQTSLTTQDFAKAIPIAAAPVKAFGGDIQELGTLLVAMKQNGIEATQGANAIKAAMQRLGRPSKQVQSEWKALTDTDITQIFDKSKNLIDLFTKIGDATKNLTPKDQIKAFAGLFGTYQVTRMMAMVKGMEQLKAGTGQVSTAAKLAGQDTAQWAKVAQTEIERYKNSMSGKWDRAIEDMKLQLSTLGKPFVEVATSIISHISVIIKWFNKLSDISKKLIAIPILLTAIAGPLLMFVGLVANLGGNGLKILSFAISTVVPKFDAMTGAQKAAALAAEEQTASTVEQAKASEYLTKIIEAQTAAQALANEETRNGMMAAMVNSGMTKEQAQARMAQIDASVGSAINTAVAPTEKAATGMAKMSRFAKNTAISMAVGAAAMVAMTVSSDKTVQNIAQWVMMASLMGPLLIPLFAAVVTNTGLIVKNMLMAAAAASELDVSMAGAAVGALALEAPLLAIGAPILAAVAAIGGVFYLIKKHQDEVDRKQQQIYNKTLNANKALNDTAANFAQNLGKAAGSYNAIIKGGQPGGLTGIGGETFGGQAFQSYQYYTKDSQGKKDAAGLKSALKDPATMMAKLRQQFLDFQKISGMTAKQATQAIQGMLIAVGTSASDALSISQKLYAQLGDIKNFDWSGALANSKKVLDAEMANSMAVASTGSHQLAQPPTRGGAPASTYTDWNAVAKDQEKGMEAIKGQIDKYAGIFVNAWRNAASPKEAQKAMNDFLAAALQEFSKEYQKMLQNPILAKLLSDKGIGSGKELANAFDSGKFTESDIAKAMNAAGKNNKNYVDPGQFQNALKFAQLFESTMTRSAAKAGILKGNIHTAKGLFEALVATGKNLTFKEGVQQVKNIAKAVKDAQRVLATQQMMNTGGAFDVATGRTRGGINDVGVAQAQNSLKTAKNTAMTAINQMNVSAGFAKGATYAEAMYNFIHKVTNETANAGNNAKKLSTYLHGLPTQMSIKLSAKESIQVVHDAMAATQSDMADSAMNQFNSRWDATMAAAQARFQKDQNALQNRQSNQSDALQRRQQNAQDAMDKRFQRQQDAVNKKYQDRIDNINKEIKAEQNADAQRQKMYEAEKKRMQDLADMANKNIDFNTAINTGQFDEAAKIKNDMQAQTGANTMDAIEARRSARVQAAVDRLQKKIDNLGKMRDKELKRLQNVEDAQKKHLQNMQQAQSKALQQRQAAETAALQKQEDAETASMQRRRDMEEANLNQRLDLFKTYVAKNQKDLEQWMHKVGLTYSSFGSDIKAQGESWASYFQKALHDHIMAGAMQITNDDMWQKITPKLANILLRGLGFKNLNAFEKFVNTGKIKQEQRGKPGGDVQHHPVKVKNHHSGGLIGHAPDDRKGLRGMGVGGMHPSETLVRAQAGEFMVNAGATAKNLSLLNQINSGSGGYGKYGVGGAGPLPLMAGLPTALIAQGFMLGTEAASARAMNAYQKSAAAIISGSSTSSGFISGPGGRHRPVPSGIGLVQGIHDAYTGYPAIDLGTPMNTPAYAVANGTITRSEAVTSGGSPGNGLYSIPYRSYGNVIYLKTDGGPEVLYAHLNNRMVSAGTRVRGGSRIGLTGNTGNSTGPHLHFGDSDGNPFEFLRNGGTVKFDNTPAILHRGETVLTDALTQKFKHNVASGGNVTYDVDVEVNGSDLSAKDVAREVIQELEHRESRKPRSRRNRDND